MPPEAVIAELGPSSDTDMRPIARVLYTVIVAWITSLNPLAAMVADGDLTARDIADLVSAARGRYLTLDVDVRLSAYYSAEDKPGNKPYQTKTIHWLVKGERLYGREESRHLRPGASGLDSVVPNVRELAISSEWVKSLEAGPVPDRPRGRVERPGPKQKWLDLDPVHAVWDPYGLSWESFSSPTVRVSRDTKTGVWKLHREISPDGAGAVVMIDPSKGFLPVTLEMVGQNQKITSSFVTSDFRDVGNGLWFPYRWVDSDYVNNRRIVAEVARTLVNTAIADSRFDIVFTRGTMVEDRILGVRYEVGTDSDLTPHGGHSAIENATTLPSELSLRRLNTGGAAVPEGKLMLQVKEAQTMVQASSAPKRLWGPTIRWAIAGVGLGIALLLSGWMWARRHNRHA